MTTANQAPTQIVADKAVNYSAALQQFQLARTQSDTADKRMAAALGASSMALTALGAGYYPERGSAAPSTPRFPEADAAGGDYCVLPVYDVIRRIVGLHLLSLDGRKDISIGTPGLVRSASWYDDTASDPVNLIVVTRDVRDVPVLFTFDTRAIAITDPQNGIAQLAQWLRRFPTVYGRWFGVVGDAQWARPTARKLRQAGVAEAYWCQPPAMPDCRSWLLARLRNVKKEADLARLGDKLWVRLTEMANEPDGAVNGPPPEVAKKRAMPLSWAILQVLLAGGKR